jgi:hypothetical protein
LLSEPHQDLNNLEKAEDLALKAWNGCLKTLGPDHHWTLSVNSILARNRWFDGKPESVIRLLVENLECYKKMNGRYLADSASDLDTLSWIYGDLGLF